MEATSTHLATAVAQQLQAERAANKLTYTELAAAAGLGQQTVMRYLNGDRDIPIRALIDLASALEIRTDELIRRAEDRLQSPDAEKP